MSNLDLTGKNKFQKFSTQRTFKKALFFRDNYVRINTGNIQSAAVGNFDKQNPSSVLSHGAYEYGSVMHYGRCDFSANGYETITALVSPAVLIFFSI